MTRLPSPPSSSSPPDTTVSTTNTNSSDNGDSSLDETARMTSAPLFAVPSVSLNNTHAVSSSIGPLTPPLTIDQQQAAHNTAIASTIKISSSPPLLPTLAPESSAKLRKVVIGQRKHHRSIQPSQRSFGSADVVHDVYCCMFRITLDTKGSIAALCYLPTRFQKMIEFYHTEIPTAYRDLGLGDLLVAQGFRWAEAAKLLVIPTCPFVQRYLDRNSTNRGCIVHNESEGLTRLFAAASLSSSSLSSASPPHHQSPPSPEPASLQHEELGTVE